MQHIYKVPRDAYEKFIEYDVKGGGGGGGYRPVGWSGDGGVRETIRVELTSGGGAFPAWGMG